MRVALFLSSALAIGCSPRDEAPHARAAPRGGHDAAAAPPATSPSLAPVVDGGASSDATLDSGGAAFDEPEILVGAFAAPSGPPNGACTRDDPCDWMTAMKSPEPAVVLMDGTFDVPANTS